MSKSEMKRKAEGNGRTSPYWICDACAKKKQWNGPDYAVTIIKGLCGHCDRPDETFLTPTSDYTKQGQTIKVWD